MDDESGDRRLAGHATDYRGATRSRCGVTERTQMASDHHFNVNLSDLYHGVSCKYLSEVPSDALVCSCSVRR